MTTKWTPERIAEARMDIDGTMPSRLLQDFTSALDTIESQRAELEAARSVIHDALELARLTVDETHPVIIRLVDYEKNTTTGCYDPWGLERKGYDLVPYGQGKRARLLDKWERSE